MRGFAVYAEIVTPESAYDNDYSESELIGYGLTLRDAIKIVRLLNRRTDRC